MIKKSGSGYKIFHCKSGKTGAINATPHPVSKEKAQSIHRAIMANALGKTKGIKNAR